MSQTIRFLKTKFGILIRRLLRFYARIKYGDLKSYPALCRDTVSQIDLLTHYRSTLERGESLPAFRDVGFREFSQTDEDGILLFLFSVYGTVNKKLLEVCCGDGIECNSANLVLRHGWTGLMIDGNKNKIERGKYFYSVNKDTLIFPPRLLCSWVNRENINNLVIENGLAGDIDLLSLDMDGVDYWVWDALEVVQPRIVVLEYQSLWGAERNVTIPYRSDFVRSLSAPDYFGASLGAFVSLGREKGYRLVGCNRYCFNAFFVRGDLPEIIKTVNFEDCFFHPKVDLSLRERYIERMRSFDWVEV